MSNYDFKKMVAFKLEKKRYFTFLEALIKKYNLIAPVKKDLIKFDEIKDVKDIYLKENSYFPIKEYFFRKKEVLFSFDGNRIREPILKTIPAVFFGVRRCDLNAIKNQDTVFNGINDPYYKEARENSILLGYHCDKAPSKYCFCGDMDLIDYFDLMFYDKKDHFLVEVGSKKGEILIKKFQKFFSKTSYQLDQKDKSIMGSKRLMKNDISSLYYHPDWKKGVDLCLSCSACTALCPSCYCFSICDEVSSKNLKKGERKREWSSCQLQEFTRVAGDFVFRKDREERFKHRIFHQLDYFKKNHGINLCVGCGRCIEGCPTRIDFIKIINEMKYG